MSNTALKHIRTYRCESSSARLVLLALADMASEGLDVSASLAELQSYTQLDRKTIIKSIQSLVNSGVIRDTGQRVGETRQVKLFSFRQLSESEALITMGMQLGAGGTLTINMIRCWFGCGEGEAEDWMQLATSIAQKRPG
jgi:hypothetical protein